VCADTLSCDTAHGRGVSTVTEVPTPNRDTCGVAIERKNHSVITQPVRLFATAILFAFFGAACSSSASITPSSDATIADTSQAVESTQSVDTTEATETNNAAETGGAAAPATEDPDGGTTLATTPVDYAAIAAGVSFTPTTPIPCQLAGPVIAAFADGRGLPLKQVTGNTCEWREGLTDSVTVHFREVAEIDVAERRRLHGADDTVVDEAGPGTNAASYLDANGVTERYFFVSGSRAVFLTAETNPPVTPEELRSMADEVATLVGDAADEGQLWQDAGEAGADPLCSVWDADTIGQLFGATAVFESSSNGCQWFMEAPNNQAHEVTISIDTFDSVEIFTRNGGSDASIGDRSATITEPGVFGTSQKIAFAQGQATLLITVDSPTNAALVDELARNIAMRLN